MDILAEGLCVCVLGGGGEGGGLLTGEWQYHQQGSAAALVL